MEKTLGIIKPDAVKSGFSDDISADIISAGFNIINSRTTTLTKEQGEQFYFVHKDREFYRGLVDFMTSGTVTLLVIEKENAVKDFRKLIGSTDPSEAIEGTIRKKYGTSIRFNAIHGSDSPSNALNEIAFFF